MKYHLEDIFEGVKYSQGVEFVLRNSRELEARPALLLIDHTLFYGLD